MFRSLSLPNRYKAADLFSVALWGIVPYACPYRITYLSRSGKENKQMTNCGACGLFIGESEKDLQGFHSPNLCDANDEMEAK
jgi:hypothetical protein